MSGAVGVGQERMWEMRGRRRSAVYVLLSKRDDIVCRAIEIILQKAAGPDENITSRWTRAFSHG